ncbi:cyclin-dependent kinase 20 isoform X2 [Phaenicophaeus curvirostris]|uniref:cyclin-dependent kinase 20 isoform X2 n=1 Tax=Phaenicophaeus curvirostris TaxID=33595 RepID=UPI0037F0A933
MEQFIVLGRVGEGAHGVVFKAKDRETGELVALKKVPLRRPEEPLPPQALREIKALREIGDHPHVVRLRCVFAQGPAVVLAFDYLVGDLGGLLRATPTPLPPPRVRALLAMTLRGLGHCHRLHLLHRDLKPANLLLDAKGCLKLADFGLARVLAPPGARPYSHQVATRWYRAPELLYGARHYDEGVDLWAVGCIFGELLNLSPLFPGENDIEQLCCILRALGTPSPRAWPVRHWEALGGTGRRSWRSCRISRSCGSGGSSRRPSSCWCRGPSRPPATSSGDSCATRPGGACGHHRRCCTPISSAPWS